MLLQHVFKGWLEEARKRAQLRSEFESRQHRAAKPRTVDPKLRKKAAIHMRYHRSPQQQRQLNAMNIEVKAFTAKSFVDGKPEFLSSLDNKDEDYDLIEEAVWSPTLGKFVPPGTSAASVSRTSAASGSGASGSGASVSGQTFAQWSGGAKQ